MQRVIPQELGYKSTGEFSVSLLSGVVAAGLAADSDIFQFRNGGSKVALVRRVEIWAISEATPFTAGRFVFRLYQARGWSADGSGGTAATLTGNNGKVRTSFDTSVATARIASTAALTAGTRTTDAQGMRAFAGPAPTAALTNFFVLPNPIQLYGDGVERYPLVCPNNEGFVIQATVPATGTWTFGVNVHWEETGGFRL